MKFSSIHPSIHPSIHSLIMASNTRVSETSASFEISESPKRLLQLSAIKSGGRTRFKWLGELDDLKLFMFEDLKLSATRIIMAVSTH